MDIWIITQWLGNLDKCYLFHNLPETLAENKYLKVSLVLSNPDVTSLSSFYFCLENFPDATCNAAFQTKIVSYIGQKMDLPNCQIS